jgi:hypothetical protein
MMVEPEDRRLPRPSGERSLVPLEQVHVRGARVGEWPAQVKPRGVGRRLTARACYRLSRQCRCPAFCIPQITGIRGHEATRRGATAVPLHRRQLAFVHVPSASADELSAGCHAAVPEVRRHWGRPLWGTGMVVSRLQPCSGGHESSYRLGMSSFAFGSSRSKSRSSCRRWTASHQPQTAST